MCVWELQYWNVPQPISHDTTKYIRLNTTFVTAPDKCPMRCVANSGGACTFDMGTFTCNVGTMACGSDLYTQGAKLDWNPESVYNCTDGRFLEQKEVQACPGRCQAGKCQEDSVAEPSSSCSAGSVLSLLQYASYSTWSCHFQQELLHQHQSPAVHPSAAAVS